MSSTLRSNALYHAGCVASLAMHEYVGVPWDVDAVGNNSVLAVSRTSQLLRVSELQKHCLQALSLWRLRPSWKLCSSCSCSHLVGRSSRGVDCVGGFVNRRLGVDM